MAKIIKRLHVAESDKYAIELRFDYEYSEWQVRFMYDGEERMEERYFTDSYSDARQTAELWISRKTK